MALIAWLSFGFILLFEYRAEAKVSEFAPPRIFPDIKEYIIDANTKLTLNCEGKEPVTWITNNTYGDTSVPKYSVIASPIRTSNSDYIYGSLLTIQNASYLDTGFYYCHGKTNDVEDKIKVSSIYVYVDDPKQLSVMPENLFVMVSQYSEAILPCRPTSPHVRVELRGNTGKEVLLNVKNKYGTIVTFDRQRGFIISRANFHDSMMYDCIFSRENVSNTVTIVLSVRPITYSIAKPYIEDLSDGHTEIGQQLKLKCTVQADVPFVITWQTPDKHGIESGRIQVSEAVKESQGTYHQILTINKTTIQDQGEYTCMVNNFGHQSNNTKYVRILENGEHFLNLTEESGLYTISVKAGEPSVQWSITVKAHPRPVLIWYNNKNEVIQEGGSDNNNQQKYYIRSNWNEAVLKINNVTISDRGKYVLTAINAHGKQSLELFLNVTE